MEETIVSEIMALKAMPLKDLKKKYEEVFGAVKATSSNRTYLFRRIAWRIQELKDGSISEACRTKIKELIGELDPINNKKLRAANASPASDGKNLTLRDVRLPIPGTIITKNYKGATLQVTVLEKGFEYNGKHFKSLTALAKEITGLHWSGYNFFGL